MKKQWLTVVCALFVACMFSVQPSLSHETEHHAETSQILEELLWLMHQLQPLINERQATAYYNARLAGKTLVFKGVDTKMVFTEPGRFYSFGDPEYPGEFNGNFTSRVVDVNTVELTFTWDPANNMAVNLLTRLSFTSRDSGTHESEYWEDPELLEWGGGRADQHA